MRWKLDNKNEYKFYKLTPTKVDKSSSSYKIIEKALNQAYEDSDIKNIAITGIYGSGKSSILRTYFEEKFNNKKTINVSIADFDNSNIKYENIYQGQKGEIDEEDNENIAEDCDLSNSSNYIDFQNNIRKLNNIKSAEKQIINQILYQISPRKIPLSRFKIKNKRNWWEITIYSICLISVITGLFMLINKEFIYNYFYQLLSFNFEGQVDLNEVIVIIDSFILTSLVIPLIASIIWIVRRTSIKFTKFKFKGAESEIMENDYTNILDQETRELVYLIWSSDIETIIFEDLDRFNDISIFIRLREINSLINFKSDNVVRFVYVIKDDLFESKDRVKFFDLMIPIIPSITSQNSRGKILEIFGDLEPNVAIDKNVLLGLSIYIDDMRLLYSIRNEYEVYSKSIDVDKNSNELFSLIVLKNIFPKEFEELERDRGYFYIILNKRESLNEQYKKELEDKIELREKLKNLLVNRVSDFLALNIPKEFEFKNEKNKSVGKIMYDWYRNKDKQYYIYNGNSGSQYTYNSFIDELCRYDDSLKSRLEEINFDDIYLRIDELNNEIKALNEKISSRNTNQMSELLNELNNQELSIFFEENVENKSPVVDDHYYDLFRHLLLSGLLDENYWAYKGYFYNSDIGKNDHIFISRVLSGKIIDNNFILDNPGSVLSYFNIDDYSRKDIVNYNLINALVEEGRDKELLRVFKVIINNGDFEAIEYFDNYSYETLKKFTLLISKSNFDEFWIGLKNEVVPYQLRSKIAGLVCLDTNLQVDDDFIHYVEKNSKILESEFLIEKSKILNTLNKFNVKFLDTSNIKVNSEIAQILLDKVMFELSLENIINLLSIKLNQDSKNVITSLFNNIYNESLSLGNLKKEVLSQIDDIVSQYVDAIEKDNLKSNSGEVALLEILNSELNSKYKRKLIRFEKTILNNIREIHSDELLIDLASMSLISYNEDNVLNFYERTKQVQPLIDMINSNYKSEFDMPQGMYLKILNLANTNDYLFKGVMRRTNKKIDKVSKDIGINRIDMLIDQNLIEYNQTNFKTIVDINNDELITGYISSILSSGVEEIEIINFMKNNSIIDHLTDYNLCYILNENILNYDSAILLLDYYDSSISLFNVLNADIDVRGYILNNYFDEEDYSNIINGFDKFDLWDDFIIIINNDSSKFDKLLNGNMNEGFVNRIITDSEIKLDYKLQFLNLIINKKKFVREWEKWISSIEEIKHIATVFNNKRPNLRSDYDNMIAKPLIGMGVCSKGNDGRLILKPSKYNYMLRNSKK